MNARTALTDFRDDARGSVRAVAHHARLFDGPPATVLGTETGCSASRGAS